MGAIARKRWFNAFWFSAAGVYFLFRSYHLFHDPTTGVIRIVPYLLISLSCALFHSAWASVHGTLPVRLVTKLRAESRTETVIYRVFGCMLCSVGLLLLVIGAWLSLEVKRWPRTEAVLLLNSAGGGESLRSLLSIFAEALGFLVGGVIVFRRARRTP